MGLYAWAHGLTPLEVGPALEPFPGLGAVLNASNYRAALLPTPHNAPFIAFVNSVGAAKKLAQQVADGAKFQAVIVNDERNVRNGPSGAYMTPAQYAAHFAGVRAYLPAGIPVSTMGLAPVGGWLRRFTWRMRYHNDYARLLPPAELRAFNANKVAAREIERTLDAGVSILSPAVFRGWWYGLAQPIKPRAWVELSNDPRVTAVCIWSLVEVNDQPHGLLTPNGELTSIGRVVQASL